MKVYIRKYEYLDSNTLKEHSAIIFWGDWKSWKIFVKFNFKSDRDNLFKKLCQGEGVYSLGWFFAMQKSIMVVNEPPPNQIDAVIDFPDDEDEE